MPKEYTLMETSLMLWQLGKYDRMPSPQSIADWIRQGRLKGRKVKGSGKGGKWVVTLESINAFEAPKMGPPFQNKGDDHGVSAVGQKAKDPQI